MQDWIKLDGNLTKTALKFIEEKGVFKYTNDFVVAFYKGDPETTTNWVFITDDGSSYKVGAQFILWTPTIIKAAWSNESLLNMLNAYLNDEPVPNDPDYQT